MDNVPKMKEGFDLYAVQLRTFLTPKDNIARETMLSGVPAQDAEMICQDDSSLVTWNRFVDKQTKKGYSNYIFLRAEFYANIYTPEKTMDRWLCEMELLRRQLLHYGKRVTEDDYKETLLGHVARTHCDVVRQFRKHHIVRRDVLADRPTKTNGIAACRRNAAQSKQQKGNQFKSKRKRAHRGEKAKSDYASGKRVTKMKLGPAFTVVKLVTCDPLSRKKK
ncbi:Hypothetical protein PHPALM_6088 [Phytophthora palmivora]|uniref:Uncharacterized protein n=1 Tax=Phytophthora palmivora TaxID=4796 RepID=A0A2P4YFS7_9STRA|nr:Hypothetical protein PHPALM_6088 [Phytophthora palmivora]